MVSWMDERIGILTNERNIEPLYWDQYRTRLLILVYVSSLVVFEPNSFRDLLIIGLVADSTFSYCALINLRDHCNLWKFPTLLVSVGLVLSGS
jgi:flagellar biosynthesis component FlhA